MALKIIALFLNGIPLGMVWGLVVWYLEGRRTADILLAALSCSFIVSSGAVKDVGQVMLDLGITEWWMPAVVGALFLPLYVFSVWLLNRLPDANAEDRAARVDREPMDAARRREYLASTAWRLGDVVPQGTPLPVGAGQRRILPIRHGRLDCAVDAMFTEVGEELVDTIPGTCRAFRIQREEQHAQWVSAAQDCVPPLTHREHVPLSNSFEGARERRHGQTSLSVAQAWMAQGR